MSLMKSRSKKAFEHNVKAEMHAGKPQPQGLAIAYSVKRKSPKKKMASGGDINPHERGVHKQNPGSKRGVSEAGSFAVLSNRAAKDRTKYRHQEVIDEIRSMPRPKLKGLAEGGDPAISAANERRPMPDNQYADSDEMRRNKGNKRPGQDSWTDNPTIKQAQKPSITPLSQPRMVESGVIRTKLRSDEHDLMDRLPPSSPKDQPSTDYNEMDAKSQGHDLRDMSKEHSTKKKPYNEDVEDQYAQDEAEDDMKQSYAKGGMATDDEEHPNIGYYHKEHGIGHDPKTNKYQVFKDNRPIAEHASEKEAKSHIDRISNQKKFAKGGMATDDEEHPNIGYYHKEHGIGHDPKTNKYQVFKDNRPIAEHASEKEAKSHIDRISNQKKFAKGGQVEDSDYDHPMEQAVDFPDDLFDDETYLMQSEDPSEDEGAAAAIMRNERGPNRQGPKVPDMAAQHNSGRKPYYMGGPAMKEDHPHLMFEDDQDNMDMDDELNPAHGGWSEDDSEETMPVDEYMAEGGRAGGEEDSWDDNGHDDSISAAIMSKRNRLHAMIDSGAMDEDEAAADKRHMYADGGEVDLSINYDEEPNNEDQMSFEALKKENYNSSNLDVENPSDSAQMGDEEERDSEDRNDMVSKIHRKMMAKRQFNR